MRICATFYTTQILHLVLCLKISNLYGCTLVTLSEMLYDALLLQLFFNPIVNLCGSIPILDIISTVYMYTKTKI